ncbi:NUDIX hydrolase 17, mitochondrial-like protein [Tanacetum coccineum]
MVSRSGRQLQRYNKGQQRQVVGCIPYIINSNNALEVLVISAQRKGKGMLFPKGGWECDETIKEAALRWSEQLEFWPEKDIRRRAWVSVAKAKEVCQYTWMKEALDLLVMKLEYAPLINKGNDGYYGHMFPLLVKEQLEFWPEKDIAQKALGGVFAKSLKSLSIYLDERSFGFVNNETRICSLD